MNTKLMDVSRFLLFEATGDSEADALMDEQSGGDDDDDAESRSPGGSDTCDWDLADQNLGVADADHEHCDGNKNEDEEETVVYGMSYCDDDDEEVEKRKQRSKLSVDSGHKFMDETEKNRRFWDACLAS